MSKANGKEFVEQVLSLHHKVVYCILDNADDGIDGQVAARALILVLAKMLCHMSGDDREELKRLTRDSNKELALVALETFDAEEKDWVYRGN